MRRARAALDNIPTTVLAFEIEGTRATLNAITDKLRDGPHILYLVCHGTRVQGQPYLWLEQEDGTADKVAGADFVQAIAQLPRWPLLIVLVSCQSAGQTHDTGVLAAIGPQLAQVGVAAVIAMQSDILMRTIAQSMPILFRELRRDGYIDRAMAAARAAIRDAPDWWAPVLFLRERDGRLWRPAADPDRQALLARYRQDILDRTRLVNLAGIPLPQDRTGRYVPLAIPLDRVYIRIQALPEAQRHVQDEEARHQVEQQANAGGKPHSAREGQPEILRALREYIYRQGQVYTASERPTPIDPQQGRRQRLI